MFDLDLPDLDANLGAAIEQAVADAGAWPVRFSHEREERRWFGIRKAYPRVLEILTADGTGHVLVDPTHWNEDAWELRPDAIPRLARLVEILAAQSPHGFEFRATWAGSPIERTIDIHPMDLVDVINAGQLNDHTRYRVISG